MLKSIKKRDKNDKNRKIAQKLKLRGTPAFIIGNTIYPGAL